jgi:hypothetical protein
VSRELCLWDLRTKGCRPDICYAMCFYVNCKGLVRDRIFISIVIFVLVFAHLLLLNVKTKSIIKVRGCIFL